jgi:DNA-binding transcriptional LysR family regulator
MEIHQLEAFTKVAELRSFTQAAEALFFSQPAVTQQVRALERAVGEPLFERQGRRVTLTSAGEALYPFASRALALLSEGRAAVEEVRTGVAGRVTLAAGPTTTIFTLPPALAAFRRDCPGVQLLVQTGTSREVTEQVIDGRADVGIVTTVYEREELVHAPLFADEILFVVHGGHPLASGSAATGQETVAALVAEPFILFPRGTGFRSYVEQWFAARGVAPRVTMELDSAEAVKAMAAAGLGAAAVPRVAVEEELAAGRLAPIPLPDEPPLYRQVCRLLRRDKYVSRPLAALLERLDALRPVVGVDIVGPLA